MIRHPQGSTRLGFSVGLVALAFSLASVEARAQTPDAPVQQSESEGETLAQGDGFAVPPAPADSNLPEVETVIPDDEFGQAVPDLADSDDTDLSEPLESIEEFERRLATEEANADPQEGAAPPLGNPALADGDETEEIGDAPIRDAELAKPLEPLDQFEVKPVDFAEAAEDGEVVEVAYKVEINGLEEAAKQSGVSLRGMFNELSALRNGDGKAANSAMVAARLTEDSQLIKTILAAEGWYSPVVNTRIDRGTGENDAGLTAVLDVATGKRYNFSQIIIEASPTVPPDLIRENLALKAGEPIVAQRVQGAEAQVAIALPENGYPFVEIGQRDILLDQDMGDGIYTLPVDIGPRARFGGFETDGDLAFDAEHVDVLARFERDELYDSRKVDDLRKALVATGLFATVSVEPKRTQEQADAESEYVTLFVNQDAGPPRTIAGSAGYGTGEGFRLEGSWTHRNMFPPEGALIAQGVLGTAEQGAGLIFRRANAGKRDRTFELAAEALHSDFDAYSAYTGRLAGQVSYSSTPIWQKKITYSFGVELLGTAERDYDFDLGRRDRKTYYIAGLNGLIGLDFTDDLLDPTEGFKLTAFARPEGSLRDGINLHVRGQLDASAYFPATDNIVLAGRVRLGSIQGADRVDIAPSRRFYAGGGGSVRGYSYQKLGELDPNGDPIGGRSLNEASAEIRYRFGNFGIVGFVDAGQSYVETVPQFSDLRFGAGLGGRYYTNFGPLRVDVATPINRRPGESRINIYISIGQAF